MTRDEALLTLNGTGPLLEVAREVSRILSEAGEEGAVIGGVAVVLHGHVRTTMDVDVYAPSAERIGDLLKGQGFAFDVERREFRKRGVPVHLVTAAQVKVPPRHFETIDEIQTISLADLISIKLRSGTENIARAQDIADVIGLIRVHTLRSDFAARIDKELRSEFRKLVKAVARE